MSPKVWSFDCLYFIDRELKLKILTFSNSWHWGNPWPSTIFGFNNFWAKRKVLWWQLKARICQQWRQPKQNASCILDFLKDIPGLFALPVPLRGVFADFHLSHGICWGTVYTRFFAPLCQEWLCNFMGKQELTNHICLCFQRSMLKRTGLVNSGGKRSLQGFRSDRIQSAFKFDRPAVPAYIPVVEQERYAGSTMSWFQVQKPLDLCLDARMMPHLVSLDRWNVVCNKPNSWSTEPGMQRNFGKTMQRLVHSSMRLKQSWRCGGRWCLDGAAMFCEVEHVVELEGSHLERTAWSHIGFSQIEVFCCWCGVVFVVVWCLFCGGMVVFLWW